MKTKYDRAIFLLMNYLNRLIVVIIIGIPNTSMRNAPTIGTTRKAFCDGPNRPTMACIFAIAFGVAPSPWPRKPEIMTAAS